MDELTRKHLVGGCQACLSVWQQCHRGGARRRLSVYDPAQWFCDGQSGWFHGDSGQWEKRTFSAWICVLGGRKRPCSLRPGEGAAAALPS